MNAYLSLIRINLRLALREKAVLFFNYVFPLIFFFAFGPMLEKKPGGTTQLVAMALVFGILGSGLFGAGIRAVAEREANILRRYKVAPITPGPILAASMVTGWIVFLPSVVLILGLANLMHGLPLPEQWGSLFILITLGAFAFRSIGLIVASVANSVAESNIIIQLMYMPMIFLSGATFPITSLPVWAQTLSSFAPATYLFSGMYGIVLRRETIAQNAVPALALIVTVIVATTVSMKLFRWEKGERISGSAKLWLLAVFAPFVLVGAWRIWIK